MTALLSNPSYVTSVEHTAIDRILGVAVMAGDIPRHELEKRIAVELRRVQDEERERCAAEVASFECRNAPELAAHLRSCVGGR